LFPAHDSPKLPLRSHLPLLPQKRSLSQSVSPLQLAQIRLAQRNEVQSELPAQVLPFSQGAHWLPQSTSVSTPGSNMLLVQLGT
jgi:hypothetical protein